MKPATANKLKYLIWLLPVAIMVAIFLFSAQDGTESGALSSGLTHWVLNTVGKLFSVTDTEAFMSVGGTVIRKLAHMTEFTMLFLSLLLAFKATVSDRVGKLRYTLVSLLITAFYACSDEIHQLFVPGRAGTVTDVLIDISVPVIITGAILIVNTKKNQGTHNG